MTTREKIQSFLEGVEQDCILLDGEEFDFAIIGIVDNGDCGFLVAYDLPLVLDVFQAQNKWSREEAEEWFETNTAPLTMMDGGPVFVDTRWAE